MSLARVLRVARLDVAHAPRRFIYWFWLVLIVFLTWGLSSGNATMASGDASVGGTQAWLTSEFSVGMQLSMLILILYAFFVAVGAGMMLIRDGELRVGELLHSTPLTAGEYVWGRFLGAFVTFGVILGLHVLAMIVIYHVLPRASMDEIRGPFELGNYVRPALVFGIPTILFFAGSAFAVGALTRRPIVVFFLPVAFILFCGFFLWNWSPTWLDPGVNRVLMFVDPAGFRWLNETWLKVDRGVDFYNESPIAYDALFVANRATLLVLGLGAVVLAQWRVARSLRGARSGVTRRGRDHEPAPAAAHGPATAARPLADLTMASRPPQLVRGALHAARFELRELRHHPGLYLFVPLILIQVVGTTSFAVGAFGTPLLQTPGTMVVSTMNTLTLLVCLLIQFYTAEAVHRDRATGAAAMVYATPVRSASLLLGKAVANVAVGVVLVAALAGCIVVLAIQGRVGFDLRPFLLVWGLVLIPTFLLWSAFVMAVASLLKSRYTIHAVCLGVLVLTGFAQLRGKMNWVSNWDAWSVIRWSDMGPLELNRGALVLNRLLVLSLAVLLVAVTARIFTRRDFDATRVVHRLRPGALFRHGLRLLPFAVVPLVLGTVLGVQVAGGHQGQRAERAAKDYWRANVATWRDAPVPALAAVDIDLELDPAGRRFRTEGTYVIRNPHAEPMIRVPLTGGTHWEDVSWRLGGEPYEPDDRSNLYVFEPDEPLAPGDSLEIGFSFAGRFPRGITRNGGGAGEFILPSGVVLTSFSPSFAPIVGYVESIGVDADNQADSREYPEGYHEGVTDPAFGAGWPFTTRLRVSGPAAYTYNSVGVCTSDEVEGDRRTVVWESDHPMTFFNVVAGRWDVRRGEGTAIYHHPAHTYNLDEMSHALEAARRHYAEWFHPYPWQELKLSEFPNLATYAQGFATNITFSEGIGFLTRSDPHTNTAFAITAHEAAHQWWGNLLMPGKGPGANILSEGMAHFSTILLLDAALGERARIEFCRRIEERYAENRVVDSERPLVRIDGSRPGDQTVTYDKGGWVFWMLLNRLGREACLEGVRAFIAHYAGDADHPVLEDFVAFMRPYASDASVFDTFVDQWFLDVVAPEYRLHDARVEPAESGEAWTVRVAVENRGTGSMPVEIAAARGERFEDPAEGRDGGSRYRDARRTVVVPAGERVDVTIPCEFEPDRVLVDPDARVLQLERVNAVATF